MNVKLEYFKPNGKWYSSSEYSTELLELFNIWDEVKRMIRLKKLPGLVENHSDFIVLVTVPEHKHNHPILLNTKSVLLDIVSEFAEKL